MGHPEIILEIYLSQLSPITAYSMEFEPRAVAGHNKPEDAWLIIHGKGQFEQHILDSGSFWKLMVFTSV